MDAGAATGADPDLGCPLASKSEKYSLARVSGVKRIAGEPVQNKLDRCLSTNLSAGLTRIGAVNEGLNRVANTHSSIGSEHVRHSAFIRHRKLFSALRQNPPPFSPTQLGEHEKPRVPPEYVFSQQMVRMQVSQRLCIGRRWGMSNGHANWQTGISLAASVSLWIVSAPRQGSTSPDHC